MKHANPPLADGVQWHGMGQALRGMGATAKRSAAGLRDWLHELMVLSQIARMQSVLRGMSDKQLAEIGVARDDIARHAEYLITGKHAG